eukprot:1914504-Rhodomonas_salina.1
MKNVVLVSQSWMCCRGLSTAHAPSNLKAAESARGSGSGGGNKDSDSDCQGTHWHSIQVQAHLPRFPLHSVQTVASPRPLQGVRGGHWRALAASARGLGGLGSSGAHWHHDCGKIVQRT